MRPPAGSATAVPLTRPKDRTEDVEHHFIPGLIAVNGGKMNCFDQLWDGLYAQGRALTELTNVPKALRRRLDD